MAVNDLYSKRQKQARGEAAGVYRYDNFPEPLRVQIVQILSDVIGLEVGSHSARGLYKEVRDILCREYGVFNLGTKPSSHANELLTFVLTTSEVDRVLDVVELTLARVTRLTRETSYATYAKPKIVPEQAILELNIRFREHGVGYAYESGQLVRVDSTLVHTNVVKPALALLADASYRGANEEFLKAHEHYRHGNYKESINEALKAFESTMKIICTKRGWSFGERDTAQSLVDTCFSKGLVSAELQSEFTALRSSLESGIPVVRNRKGGHGQCAQVIEVPAHLAGYLLHMTAATILFLVQSEQALP